MYYIVYTTLKELKLSFNFIIKTVNNLERLSSSLWRLKNVFFKQIFFVVLLKLKMNLNHNYEYRKWTLYVYSYNDKTSLNGIKKLIIILFIFLHLDLISLIQIKISFSCVFLRLGRVQFYPGYRLN